MYSIAFVVAMSVVVPRVNLPMPEIEKRFEAACVDGRWAADCPALRTEIELQLLGDLRGLLSQGTPLDRDLLRTAARGHFPPLVDFGLQQLQRIEAPADRDAVVAALEHPSPQVRLLAKSMMEQANDPWMEKQGRWWQASGRSDDALVPDVVPDLEALGLPALGDLRYRFFASGQRRAVFTTKVAPDQLLDLIAKGKKVLTGAQIGPKQQEAAGASIQDLQKEIQAALARGDLDALQAIGKRASTLSETIVKAQESASMKPVAEFTEDPAKVRYVQLPTKRAGAVPVTAALARDDAFGETVLVISY